MKARRIGLATAGLMLTLFGVFRLLTEIPARSLILLGIWLLSALILHDAVVAPAIVGVGWILRRTTPDRERGYLQSALIMIALVTVVAAPMIVLRGSQPPVKALLLRDYAANLVLLIGTIIAVAALRYGMRLVRDHPPAAGQQRARRR
jgi:sugar phosphate permease